MKPPILSANLFYFFFAHVLASTKTMMVSTTMMPVIVSSKDTSFSSLGMKHKGGMITERPPIKSLSLLMFTSFLLLMPYYTLQ